jgi:predicted porin
LEFGISRYWLRGNRFYLFNSLGIGLDKHDDVLSFTNINAQAVTPNISFSRDLLDSYLSDNSGYGNYLFGNLGIAYQLNWRWSVLATLDYRYYYTGQSENQELLAAEDNSSSPTNEMNSLSSVSIKKNNDFMINLGAEYKLSERLALFSKLYYQLNSSYTISVNNENLEKLNLSKMKELRIGLNYSF